MDLITRLLLNTQQFDQNLGKSSQQIQGFQRNINTFSTGAIGAFTKFAGGVGLAMGGLETFNKVIGSTQTTADLFGNNLVATTSTVDAFFVSLNSGDWNAFSNGIIDAYKNMKVFADMMDELEDKRLSLIFTTADNMKDLAKYEEIIKNPESTREQKIDAAQNYSGIVNYQAKKTMDAIALEKAALIKNYSSRSGMNIDLSDLTYFASNTNADSNLTNESIAKYKESLRLQKEYEKLKKAAEYDATTYGNDPSRKAQKEFADLKKVSDEYYRQNQFMIKQGFIANESDKSREALYKTLTSIRSQEEGIYQLEVKRNKLSKTVHKGADSTTSSSKSKAVVVNPLPGSIAYDRAKLADLKKQFENETNEGVRAGLRKAIELEEIKLKIKIDGSNLEEIKSNGIKPTGKSIKGDLASGAIKVKGVDDKKLIDADPSDLDYLNSMSTLMTSISSATGQASDNWLNYTANVLAGVGQLLPQLFQVFGIKSKIAIAESAALPPPLNIIAMAATAAALASTIASLPKFADGGIIGGSSFIGDNMIARVNSGEMILNGTQQRNLFNLLDGKGGSIGSSASVEFKISGKDLVGTLNNQMSKTNKYK